MDQVSVTCTTLGGRNRTLEHLAQRRFGDAVRKNGGLERRSGLNPGAAQGIKNVAAGHVLPAVREGGVHADR